MSIRVEIEDGRRKAKVESCGLGDQVAWDTYRALAESMWNVESGMFSSSPQGSFVKTTHELK